jgi:hypothetical protein
MGAMAAPVIQIPKRAPSRKGAGRPNMRKTMPVANARLTVARIFWMSDRMGRIKVPLFKRVAAS